MAELPSSEAERWCEERCAQVAEYLRREGVSHGRIGEWPAWHVAPYVSIWAIESATTPDSIDWWVICGDGPTDGLRSLRTYCVRSLIRPSSSARQRRGRSWDRCSRIGLTC